MEKKPENVHKGHRQRMRERYLASEGVGFSAHELLELYLYSSIPQKDINGLAHELLDRFGSLEKVIETDYESLLSVKNMTASAAVQIKLLKSFYKELTATKKVIRKNSAVTRRQITEYVIERLKPLKVESTIVIFLTEAYRFIKVEELSVGNEVTVSINIAHLLKRIISLDASYIILAHNHPFGTEKPSEDDIYATRVLMQRLYAIEVELLDHYVVSADKYVSLWDEGYIDSYKRESYNEQAMTRLYAVNEEWYEKND